MRLATYNIEWFANLFDRDDNLMPMKAGQGVMMLPKCSRLKQSRRF